MRPRTKSGQSIAGGALEPLEGRLLLSSNANVAAVYVRGTGWSSAFRAYMGTHEVGDGTLGFRVDDKTGNASIIPWINIDQVVIRYDGEPPRLQPFMVELDGDRPGGDHTVTAVTDIDFDTWALTLDRPLGTLSTGGENGVKVNLSVVGVGVGDLPYTLRLNVLQGDVNQSGAVLADDFSDVKKKFFRSTAAPGAAGDTQYTVFHDVNGSGSILADDFSEVKKRFFDTLQGGAAAPAAHPTAAAIAAPTRPRTLPVTRSLFGDQPLLPAQALAAESHQVMVVGSASADRFFSFRPVESPVFRPRG